MTPRAFLFSCLVFSMCLSVACAGPAAGPRLKPAVVDRCQTDCTSWLKYSLAAALLDQRRHLCGCFGAGASPEGTTAELRVLISTEGIAGVHVVRAARDAALSRCLTRGAGQAVESWLRLRPGWFRHGGSWSQGRLGVSWRRASSSVHFDWEGLTCQARESQPPNDRPSPGDRGLSAAWRKEHPDGLVCRVFHCAPSPGCCKPRNVVWQFPLVRGGRSQAAAVRWRPADLKKRVR